VVLSVVVGVGMRQSLVDRARQEVATRTPVHAILLRDSTPPPGPVDQDSLVIGDVPVRYLDTDGAVRDGLAPVAGARRAGDTTTIWVDRAHHVVARPTTEADATTAGSAVGALVLLVSLAALTAVWLAVRRLALARNCARWGREWAVVEPLWSGRTFGGTHS
jgi:hypothetical protein